MKVLDAIYIDLDDTLNNLTLAALWYYGVNISSYADLPTETYEIRLLHADAMSKLGNNDRTFSRPSGSFFSSLGMRFWIDFVTQTEWADSLVTACRDIARDVRIITCPAGWPDFLGGKYAWVKRYLPGLADSMIICRDKWLLSKPCTALIDDKVENLEQFDKRGGIAVPLVRPWNIGYSQRVYARHGMHLAEYRTIEDSKANGALVCELLHKSLGIEKVNASAL